MELRAGDVQMLEFLFADFDSGFVFSLIQRGANCEALLGGCVSDQIHNDCVTGERTPAPVLGDKAEQPMFNLVPFTGAWGGSGRRSRSFPVRLPTIAAISSTVDYDCCCCRPRRR